MDSIFATPVRLIKAVDKLIPWVLQSVPLLGDVPVETEKKDALRQFRN